METSRQPKDVFVFNTDRNLNIKTLDIIEICFKILIKSRFNFENTKKLSLIFFHSKISLNFQNKQYDLSCGLPS